MSDLWFIYVCNFVHVLHSQECLRFFVHVCVQVCPCTIAFTRMPAFFPCLCATLSMYYFHKNVWGFLSMYHCIHKNACVLFVHICVQLCPCIKFTRMSEVFCPYLRATMCSCFSKNRAKGKDSARPATKSLLWWRLQIRYAPAMKCSIWQEHYASSPSHSQWECVR